MAILWDDDLPKVDGVKVDMECLAEVAMLADLARIVRENLRRIGRGLTMGLAGVARAVGG